MAYTLCSVYKVAVTPLVFTEISLQQFFGWCTSTNSKRPELAQSMQCLRQKFEQALAKTCRRSSEYGASQRSLTPRSALRFFVCIEVALFDVQPSRRKSNRRGQMIEEA
ncbi:unnamed protein product [Soboliphyme baturini]|uniref:Secreted protein n=1 Tax=Soboliphyme baturini TaxID=241478 RepID=A0A183IRI9_9BILA|nr:unnamed protein product [Soboliphyme baturini]